MQSAVLPLLLCIEKSLREDSSLQSLQKQKQHTHTHTNFAACLQCWLARFSVHRSLFLCFSPTFSPFSSVHLKTFPPNWGAWIWLSLRRGMSMSAHSGQSPRHPFGRLHRRCWPLLRAFCPRFPLLLILPSQCLITWTTSGQRSIWRRTPRLPHRHHLHQLQLVNRAEALRRTTKNRAPPRRAPNVAELVVERRHTTLRFEIR